MLDIELFSLCFSPACQDALGGVQRSPGGSWPSACRVATGGLRLWPPPEFPIGKPISAGMVWFG